jgi:hypothetical protein
LLAVLALGPRDSYYDLPFWIAQYMGCVSRVKASGSSSPIH